MLAPHGAPGSGEDGAGCAGPASASTPPNRLLSAPQLLPASEVAGCSGEDSAWSSSDPPYCA